jgi:hypothetical protein
VIVLATSLFDRINDLLGPSMPAIGLFSTIVGIVPAFVWLLKWLQRISGSARTEREAERAYLTAIVRYVRELHIHSAFEERFFVSREFTLRNRYQSRSFFVAARRSLFEHLGVGTTPFEGNRTGHGYYTRDLLHEALSDKATGPLIILGEPGSGKSVSARQLVINAAQRQLRAQAPGGKLPILVSLRDYAGVRNGAPVPFYDFLREAIQERHTTETMPSHFLDEHFDGLLGDGRLLLVLDGLDEMPPLGFSERCDELSTFMLRHGMNSFVLTCRSTEFAGQIHGRDAYLDWLTPGEIRAFIRKRKSLVPDTSPRRLYRQLTSDAFVLAPLVNSPFYLNLILQYHLITGELPEDVPRLLRAVCNDWAVREVHKKFAPGHSDSSTRISAAEMSNVLIESLGQMAFAISNSAGFGSYMSNEELRELLTKQELAEELAADVIRMSISGGILESPSPERLRFVHHKFQEYFAAEMLNRMLKQGTILYADLPIICRNIWWNEVVSILAGIADEPAKIIDALLAQRRGGTDVAPLVLPLSSFRLAGRSVRLIRDEGERQQKTREILELMEKLLDDWRTPIYERYDALRAIAELDADEATDLLSDKLTSRSRIERELSLSGLARTARGRAYLSRNAARVGRDVYVYRKYGTIAGRHTNSLGTIPFQDLGTVIILNFWRVVGVIIKTRGALLAILLSTTIFQPLLQNLYTAMFVAGIVVFDLTIYRNRSAKVPVNIALALLAHRSILLGFLTLLLFMGLMRPPFFVFPFFVMAVVATTVTCYFLYLGVSMAARFVGSYGGLTQRRESATAAADVVTRVTWVTMQRAWMGFSDLMNERSVGNSSTAPPEGDPFGGWDIKSIALHAPDAVAEQWLRDGRIDAETYAKRFTGSPEGLQALAKELRIKDLGGKELELLDLLENLERQEQQASTRPLLPDTIVRKDPPTEG